MYQRGFGGCLCRFVTAAALGSDAAHLLDVGNVAVEIAQVEAVDVAVGHCHGADALGRWRFAVLFLLVAGVGRRLELTVAEMALDAVAVEQPEGGARIEPTQHHHVALDALQE